MLNNKPIIFVLSLIGVFYTSDTALSTITNILNFPIFTVIKHIVLLLLCLMFILSLILSIPIIAIPLLIACGLYYCPDESTFEPWLRSFVNGITKQNWNS